VSIQTLELELKKAIGKRDFDHARSCLSQIRQQGVSDDRLAYLEALIMGRDKANKKGDALNVLIAILNEGVDDIDLIVQVCADALFFAESLNDVTRIKRIHAVVDDLIENHGDHPSVIFWRGTIEMHIGCIYVNQRRYNEAVTMLTRMISHANDDPSYVCHVVKARVYLAIALVRIGRLADAAKQAHLAEIDAVGRFMALAQRAWGEIYLAEKNVNESRRRFEMAQSIVARSSSPDDQTNLAWITLGLCAVYKALNDSAHTQATILVRQLAYNNDLPCVLEALADIEADRL
jgi:tetratricopeptide (TPR) repeat protein